MVKLLLAIDVAIEINGSVLTAAAGNKKFATEMVIALRSYTPKIQISEVAWIAAVHNSNDWEFFMDFAEMKPLSSTAW